MDPQTLVTTLLRGRGICTRFEPCSTFVFMRVVRGIKLTVVLLAAAASGLAVAAPGTTAPAQSGEILGFDVDEERHYALGPPEALERGESATWNIRLARVEGSGSDRRAGSPCSTGAKGRARWMIRRAPGRSPSPRSMPSSR